MGTGKRIKRKLAHAAYLRQCFLESPIGFKSSLHRRCRLQRMQIGKRRISGYLLVDLRIILHCTGSQRIESRVYAEIIGTHIGIVPDYRRLIDFRQPRSIHAEKRGRNRRQCIGSGIVGQRRTAPSMARQFIYQLAVIFLVHDFIFLTVFTRRSISSRVCISVTAINILRGAIFTPHSIPCSRHAASRSATSKSVSMANSLTNG